MTTIPVGAGDSLRSDSIEGRIVELALYHDIWQRDPDKNPNANTRVTWGITGTTPSVSGQISFKVAPASNQSGQMVINVVEYLLNTGFSNSSNVIKSANPSAHLVELLFYAQSLENNPLKNPTARNSVSVVFDSDSDLCTGSFTLDLETQIDVTDGKTKFAVKQYLL